MRPGFYLLAPGFLLLASVLMEIVFSHPEVLPLEVPDSDLLAVLEPRRVDSPKPLVDLVQEALDHPTGSPPLEVLVSPSARVLFLVDDITRQTPAWGLLPSILRRRAQRPALPQFLFARFQGVSTVSSAVFAFYEEPSSPCWILCQ